MNQREHQRAIRAVVHWKSELDALISQYQSVWPQMTIFWGQRFHRNGQQFPEFQPAHLCLCIAEMLENCDVH